MALDNIDIEGSHKSDTQPDLNQEITTNTVKNTEISPMSSNESNTPRLAELKKELQGETAKSSESLPIKQAAWEVIQKRSMMANFRNWLKYPSSVDKNIVRKVTEPALAITISSIPVIGGSIVLSAFGTSPEMIGTGLVGLAVSGSVGLTSVTVVGLGEGLEDRLLKKEEKNRMGFSKMVTCSRAYLTPFSIFRKALTKMGVNNPGPYIGELHFVGKRYEDWKSMGKTERIADILEGLNNLAISCRNNNLRLSGITYFGVMSNIIQPTYFGDLGFGVKEVEDVVKLSKFGKVINRIKNKFGIKNEAVDPLMKTDDAGYIGIISRHELVNRQEIIANKLNQIKSRLNS